MNWARRRLRPPDYELYLALQAVGGTGNLRHLWRTVREARCLKQASFLFADRAANRLVIAGMVFRDGEVLTIRAGRHEPEPEHRWPQRRLTYACGHIVTEALNEPMPDVSIDQPCSLCSRPAARTEEAR